MAEAPVLEFDPFDGPHLTDPHGLLAGARRTAPMFFSPALRTWVVTRYDDIVRILGPGHGDPL